ncbi:MAG TPA: glycosyl transferase family 2, partial [Actinomycetota bacterium]|nr:glycosyl transferase family 2 [Actinomycetota bacterium]
AVTLPEPEEVDADRFMPSSRSIAFRREVFEKAERYPEWLDIGEDMYLNHRLRELPIRMDFAPEAIAYWRPRPNVSETWRQYFRYAEGDAVAGMYPERHAVRFATYGLLAWALARRNRALLALLGAGATTLVGRRARRLFGLLHDPSDRARAMLSLPGHIALADLAKMAGYLSGLSRRSARERR